MLAEALNEIIGPGQIPGGEQAGKKRAPRSVLVRYASAARVPDGSVIPTGKSI